MTSADLQANKAIVQAFIAATNRRDYDALEALFHKDFVWNTAVVGDDEPNELRPMQSKALRGTNLPHWKPRLTRDEALKVWRSLFQGQYEDAHMTASGAAATRPPSEEKPEHQLRMDILGMTAEDDRVAVEAKSHMIHPVTGRRYHNLYHFLFRIRDGKLTLFKEYQDTLHIYDFLAD